VVPNASVVPVFCRLPTALQRGVSDSLAGRCLVIPSPEVFTVKHQLGMLLQLVVLSVLPALILYQLYFGLELIVMPICLLAGVVLFAAGTHLREN
jgi:hypothetical protein